MAEIKWIKIKTDIFDDEKIKIIDKYPARDEIIVIWFKLLSLAGKVNQNGFLFMSSKIAYTTEMLSAVFNREENSIKMALNVFTKFGMIEIEDNEIIKIANWEKHQNIEGMDKVREMNRLRVEKHREKQRNQLPEPEVKDEKCNVTCNVTETHGNALDIDIDIDIDIELDKEKEKEICKNSIEIVLQTWNDLCLTQIRSIKKNSARGKSLNARFSEYGLNEIVSAIKSINHSDFLKGKNDKGWTITFDWLMKPNNFEKVLEGNYLNKGAVKNASNQPSNKPVSEWEREELDKARKLAEQGSACAIVDF